MKNRINEEKKPLKYCRNFTQETDLNNHIKTVHEGKKPFKCKICDYSCIKKPDLNQHIESDHKVKNLVKLENFAQNRGLIKHIMTIHKGEKPFKCIDSDKNFAQTGLKHVKTVHDEKSVSKSSLRGKETLKISNLKINRGLNSKEELLKYTIQEQNCDIIGVSEVDIQDFDEKKPFTLEGYVTYFPLQKIGSNKTRLLCFVKDYIEVTKREDIMSNLLSNVWIQIYGKGQKILLCFMYREFNDLTNNGPLSIEQQIKKLKILHLQIEKATQEGMILVIGDLNIDQEK